MVFHLHNCISWRQLAKVHIYLHNFTIQIIFQKIYRQNSNNYNIFFSFKRIFYFNKTHICQKNKILCECSNFSSKKFMGKKDTKKNEHQNTKYAFFTLMALRMESERAEASLRSLLVEVPLASDLNRYFAC